MEKTRKERLSAEKNKKSFVQSRNSNELIKKGTAVFSTTLLVSLLAFPAFSASASANELAKTSSEKLENTLEQNSNVIEKEGTKVAIETTSDTYIAEEDLIEKDQKISELKASMPIEIFETLEIDKLSMEEIDELLLTALEKMTEEETEKADVNDNQSKDELSKSAPTEIDAADEVVTEPEVVEEKIATPTKAIKVVEPKVIEKSTDIKNDVPTEGTENKDQVAETVQSDEVEVPSEVEISVPEEVLEEKTEEPTKAIEVAEPEVEETVETVVEVEEPKVEKEVVQEKTVAPTTKAKTVAPTKAVTTATTKVAAKTAVAAKTYTVKSGDTLNKISKAKGVTVTELKKWNNLSSDLIQIGQVLALNETAAKTTPVKTPSKTNEAIAGAKTPAGFVNAVASYAQQVAAKNNLYASVMIAQAALESGYGGSKLSSSPNHNLFGIKGSYNGNTVTMYTSEWSASTGWIYIPQNFKKYPSYAESLQDNANLIQNGTSWDNGYYSGAWVSNSDSAFEATAWLQGRYATDPTYASKLNAIINSYNLTQYDTKSSGVPTQNTPVSNDNTNVSTPTPNTENTTSTSYTVKSGDTLTGIGSKHGVSVSNLKSWNSLKSDTIYVNQTLTIKGGSTSAGGTTTPTPSTNTENTTSTSYTVKSGDTLTGISSKYGVSVSELKTWNSLKSDTIYVNQALTIKGGTTTPAPSTNTGNTTSASYTVKSGDTLTGISSKYGVSVSNLKSWNSLKSDTIYVNQALTIKGGTTTPAPSTNTGNTTSTSYTVKSGDTLTGISSKYGVSVSELKTWNSLKSDTIYVNQALTIKDGAVSGGTTTPAPSTNTGNTTSASYTVKSGDTLTGISSKYGVSVSDLKTWNSLKSDTIYVNQALTIKGGAVSGGTTTPTPSPNTGNTTSASYAVKSGDTLTGISSKYGVSVSNLKSWNNLKTDAIFVNQALTIKGGAVSGGTTTPSTNTGNTTSTSYTVKSGDTLTGISSKYGVSVSDLKTWNNLKTDAIFVNQALAIKGGTTTPAPSTNTENTTSASYTVKSGDTLTGISSKYGVSVSDLKSWNSLKTDTIYVNQALTIKGGTVSGGTTTPTPSKTNTTSTSYTVKSGDTLSGISSKHGVSVAELKTANKLTSDTIYVGQKLVVKSTTTGSTTVVTAPTSSKTHKIVSGDSLWSIAQQYGMSVSDLKAANYLKSDVIFVGQSLIIK